MRKLQESCCFPSSNHSKYQKITHSSCLDSRSQMGAPFEMAGAYFQDFTHLGRVKTGLARQYIQQLEFHAASFSVMRTDKPPMLLYNLFGFLLLVLALRMRSQIYLLLRFVWSCFLAPIGHGTAQKDRLDKFYGSQAEIYDATRGRLLRGREDMLRLTASHLKDQLARGEWEGKKLVWVDIGGGTGYNIEQMSDYMDIKLFDAVFLIDLCE